MYLPFFVLPYQRDPGLWYTPDAVLTHTMPAATFEVFSGFAAEEEVCVFEDGIFEAEVGNGELSEAGAAESELADAEEGEADLAEAGLSIGAGVVFGFSELLEGAV